MSELGFEMFVLVAFAFCVSSICEAFDSDDFEIFRELVIAEIKNEQSGLTLDNDLVNLFDGFVPGDQPLIPGSIRLAFHDCGLSRADCWSLAATIAVEQGANNTLTSRVRGFFNNNPTQVDLFAGDIPYYIGRKDCPTSPDISDYDKLNNPFRLFDTFVGWDNIENDLKT